MSTAPRTAPDISSIPTLRPQINKPSEFLTAAIAVLDERGWCTGVNGWKNRIGELCVLGALCEVTYPASQRSPDETNPHSSEHFLAFSDFSPVFRKFSDETMRLAHIQEQAELALAHTQPVAETRLPEEERFNLAMRKIWYWNDSHMSLPLINTKFFQSRSNKHAYQKEIRPVLGETAERLAGAEL